MNILYYIGKLGGICFYFLLGELILFVIFVKSDKGKSSTVKIRPGLYKIFKGTKISPYISTTTYVIFFIMFLVIAYLLSLSETTLIQWVLSKTSLDQIRLNLISIFMVPFWIAKVEFDRKWKNKAVWIPLVIVGLVILSFLLK